VKIKSIIILSLLCFACKNKQDDLVITQVNLYEQGEDLPGGEYSTLSDGILAFNKAFISLNGDEKDDFFTGNSLFDKDWVIAPASTTARDGLGPFFNAKACGTCHRTDGRGRPPVFDGEIDHGLLLRLSIPGTGEHGGPKPHPVYGDQLQDQSIPGISRKGLFNIDYEGINGRYDDGTSYILLKPLYRIRGENYGQLPSDIMISPRVAPQMIGLGLLEAINEAELLAKVDEFDSDQDGISGKANYPWDKENQTYTLGRFGWKANQPNLRQQNADAFLGDIGITTSINPVENCIEGDCENAPNGGSPEIRDELLDKVEVYSQSLSPPYRRDAQEDNVLLGKQIFKSLNCTGCHTQSYTTGRHKISALSNQKIFPYTDLLLHDMGENLADNRPEFDADGREWKTPPLWGIGKFSVVSNHTRYMHDGRARNLEEAILWHGGEAAQSVKEFKALEKQERELLLTFLNSL
jgi:CxxC motif-containing protein (DUF1111 family)